MSGRLGTVLALAAFCLNAEATLSRRCTARLCEAGLIQNWGELGFHRQPTPTHHDAWAVLGLRAGSPQLQVRAAVATLAHAYSPVEGGDPEVWNRIISASERVEKLGPTSAIDRSYYVPQTTAGLFRRSGVLRFSLQHGAIQASRRGVVETLETLQPQIDELSPVGIEAFGTLAYEFQRFQALAGTQAAYESVLSAAREWSMNHPDEKTAHRILVVGMLPLYRSSLIDGKIPDAITAELDRLEVQAPTAHSAAILDPNRLLGREFDPHSFYRKTLDLLRQTIPGRQTALLDRIAPLHRAQFGGDTVHFLGLLLTAGMGHYGAPGSLDQTKREDREVLNTILCKLRMTLFNSNTVMLTQPVTDNNRNSYTGVLPTRQIEFAAVAHQLGQIRAPGTPNSETSVISGNKEAVVTYLEILTAAVERVKFHPRVSPSDWLFDPNLTEQAPPLFTHLVEQFQRQPELWSIVDDELRENIVLQTVRAKMLSTP